MQSNEVKYAGFVLDYSEFRRDETLKNVIKRAALLAHEGSLPFDPFNVGIGFRRLGAN